MKICLTASPPQPQEDSEAVSPPSTLELAMFLKQRNHDVLVLLTGPGDSAAVRKWQGTGLEMAALSDDKLVADGAFYPAFLETAWRTYRWLKGRHFDAVLFRDDSSAGLIAFQAKTLGEAFASTHLGYHLYGPAQWSAHLREPRQLVNFDPVLDYSVQYAVESCDRLVVPAAYFKSRIERSGWRLPDKISVLPCFPQVEESNRHASGLSTSRHLVYPVHSADSSEIYSFLRALACLPERSDRLHLTFVAYGSRKDTRHFTKRVRRYVQTHLPNLEWDVQTATATNTQGLWIFSPLWANLPGLLLRGAGPGGAFLCARTDETSSVQCLDGRRVEWNGTALAERIGKFLEGGEPATQPAFAPGEVEGAWDDYLSAVAAEKARPGSELTGTERVSLCVAHFNKADHLAEALESLRGQTYANLEVIVVDDASDETEARQVFAAEARRHAGPDWQFVSAPENRGPGHARNLAAAHATGPYLLFFDADDVAFPGMVERMLRGLLRPNVDCVAGSSRRFREKHGKREMTETSTYAGGSLESAFLLPPAGTVFMVRRETFLEAKGFRDDSAVDCHEDWNFHVRLLAQGRSIHVLPEPVFGYRSSDHSRVTLVRRNMINNLEPFLEGTPEMRRRLLHFTLNRAMLADYAVKTLRDLNPASPGMRFQRFLARTKRNLRRRRGLPGRLRTSWIDAWRRHTPDLAVTDFGAECLAGLEAATFFTLRLTNYLLRSRRIRAVLDHLKMRRAFRPRWTPRSLDTALELVETTGRIFRGADLSYMAYAGTLLGIERHGGAIPWDDDIDLCIEGRDLPKLLALTGRLAEHGVQLVESGLCYKLCWRDRHAINRDSPWSWPFIDIFVWDRIGDRLVMRQSRDHYALAGIFPLREAAFHRLTVPVPQDSHAFLKEWYGPDFMKTAVSSTYFHRQERVIRRRPIVTPYPLPTWRPFFSRRRLPRRQLCEQLLRAATEFLAASNVEFWAEYGTLLGVYRNRSLLPHELDVDLSFMEEAVPRLLANVHLLHPDFEFYDTSARHNGPKFGIVHRKYGGNCDFYVYRRVEGGRLGICLGDEWKGTMDARDVPEAMIFPLEPARIDGMAIRRPRAMKEYLTHRYGYIGHPAVLKDDGSGHYRSIWAQEPLEAVPQLQKHSES